MKVDDECSERLEVKQGVRQGCPMSPWLLNIFLDMEGELNRRIGSAISAFESLKKNVFRSQELSCNAKVEVYNAVVVPMMMYRCESCMSVEKEEGQAAGNRDECIKEGSRND